jgi:hypothetical protein
MRAFHVLSTRPSQTYYERGGGLRFQMEDFEILTLMLSALEWRRHNGPITLYADAAGAEYFSALGLSALWDGGIDTNTLEKSDLNTSFDVFWASGRTAALVSERAPCALLDMDLIVWRNIDSLIRASFMAIHSESLDFDVYVPKEHLHTPPGYVWGDWDWSVSPLNAALVYFGRDDILETCLREGLNYLHGNLIEREYVWPAHAVFVEQRLYPMCVAKLGIRTEYFLENYDGKRLADGTMNDVFTHLWVYKRRLMHDIEKRSDLCRRLSLRLLRDFPEWRGVLARIRPLAPYVKGSSTRVSLAVP